jgi:hypothetical protein
MKGHPGPVAHGRLKSNPIVRTTGERVSRLVRDAGPVYRRGTDVGYGSRIRPPGMPRSSP